MKSNKMTNSDIAFIAAKIILDGIIIGYSLTYKTPVEKMNEQKILIDKIIKEGDKLRETVQEMKKELWCLSERKITEKYKTILNMIKTIEESDRYTYLVEIYKECDKDLPLDLGELKKTLKGIKRLRMEWKKIIHDFKSKSVEKLPTGKHKYSLKNKYVLDYVIGVTKVYSQFKDNPFRYELYDFLSKTNRENELLIQMGILYSIIN